jgi:hypothetical protein
MRAIVIVLVMAAFLSGCEKMGSANVGVTSETSIDATMADEVRRQMAIDDRESSEVRIPAWAPFISAVVREMPPELSLPTEENWPVLPYAAIRLDGKGGIRVSAKLLRELAVQRDSEACRILRENPEVHPQAALVLKDELAGEAKQQIEDPAAWEGEEFDCLRESVTLAAFTAASWGSISWPVSPVDNPDVAEFFIKSVGVNTKFAARAIEDIQDLVARRAVNEDKMAEVFIETLEAFAHSTRFDAAIRDAGMFAKGVVDLSTGSSGEFPVQAQVSGQLVGLDSKGANLIAYGKPWFGGGVVAGGSWDLTTSSAASMTASKATDSSTRSNAGSRTNNEISTR